MSFSLNNQVVSACIALAVFSLPSGSDACTSFVLTSADGSSIYGRTMEFGVETKSGVSLIPAGFKYEASTGVSSPMVWTAKHNVIAMNAFEDEALVADGMNQAGLAGGILYFPGFAEYAETSSGSNTSEIAPGDFLYWALSNFETVDEVRHAIEAGDVSVVGVKLEALGAIPPFHYTLHDKSGGSIVVEPVGGELKVYENATSIMTNSPGFEWHMANLRNYVNLSPVNKDNTEALEVAIESFGQGSGWLGLPGDPTPPSRFIRAMSFVSSVDAGETARDALNATQHILNNFDIPYGWVQPGSAQQSSGETANDYTQWSVMADLTNGSYFVRSHDALTYHSLGFAEFSADMENIVTYSLPEGPEYEPLNKQQ